MEELSDKIDELKDRMSEQLDLMDKQYDKIDEIKKLMEEQLEVMNKILEMTTQYNGDIISELNRNRDTMLEEMKSINRGIGVLM